jgi:hypothetical protein
MINVLISFAHWDESILDLPIFKKNKVRLFIDSGAFTNFTQQKEVVKLDDYMHFLKEHKSIIWNYINLDKIGCSETSQHNLKVLEGAGYNPIPVFTKATHKQTPSERFKSLYELQKDYEYICLGGIAGGLNKKNNLHYLYQCCHYLNKWRTKYHILGCGNTKILKLIKPYSADSSASSICAAYGYISLYFNGKFHRIHNPKKPSYKAPENINALKAYNLFSEQVTDPVFWSTKYYDERVILSIQSYCRFQDFLTRYNSNYFQAMIPAHFRHLDDAYWRQYA